MTLLHSLPHGTANSTEADQRLLDRLRTALAVVEVRVIDYLIIADTIRPLHEINI